MNKLVKNGLPKSFKCSVNKNGLIISIHLDGNAKLPSSKKVISRYEHAHNIVREFAKKNRLDEIESGIGIDTWNMDWRFVSKDVERTFIKEGNELLNNMKTFFKKWSNSYVASDNMYEIVEKMRILTESDER